jgi:hypothetical protein
MQRYIFVCMHVSVPAMTTSIWILAREWRIEPLDRHESYCR